ncbi:MAG TPA: ABC transporter permease [Candidatus Thiothrix moscowensis]|uniref:ABC transporter permease n=1 Tax=unclassified Thiothrix TaxID=2636184 RepID=UPI0025DE75AA|nr:MULTISPECIES: ABC transporter permease [unclassified Thiothrix]HRJ52665.1 ABC transporter permease [Candidatus Thiothrix moscowensis]HRJ92851.1 ABC transporter permease [Candidatus Thiothrix moscowensis]
MRPAQWRQVRLLVLVGFLLLWQLAAWWLASRSLPTPVAVLEVLWQQLLSGELLKHLGATLARMAASFSLAMLVGVAIGILMGNRRVWNELLDVLLILALNIPALVTIILCYLWLGLGETAAVLAVALNKMPTVVVTLREGARAVDRQLLEVAQVYRLSRWQTFSKVYLPQLYPYLFAAARNGLALIWKIVLVVELLGRSNGVGFQLGNYFHFFDIKGILAYTLAFALIVLALETLLLRPLEQRLNRWRR